jgi:hypothetical protein
LFVHELLNLEDGRENLQAFVHSLGSHLNWQTTFLQAFQKTFPRLIDVDKWWALSAANFGGRDLMSVWPLQTSWSRLEEILSTPVQVRLQAKELPMATHVTLQTVIGEWDYARQAPILKQKINHLQALRLRSAAELLALLDGYLGTLDDYIARRGKEPSQRRKPENTGAVKSLVAATVRRLNQLDSQRELLQQQLKAPTAAQALPNRQ